MQGPVRKCRTAETLGRAGHRLLCCRSHRGVARMSPLCTWSLLACRPWLCALDAQLDGSNRSLLDAPAFDAAVCTAVWMTPRTVAAKISFDSPGESIVDSSAAPFRAWPQKSVRVSRASCGFLFLVVGEVVSPGCKPSALCSLQEQQRLFLSPRRGYDVSLNEASRARQAKHYRVACSSKKRHRLAFRGTVDGDWVTFGADTAGCVALWMGQQRRTTERR